MKGEAFRVSPWQLAVLCFTLALCVSPLGVVRLAIGQLGRNGWIAMVPALCVGLWGVAVALALARRRPGVPLDAVAQQAFGRYLGYPYTAALVLLFAAGAPINLHVFARSVHLTVLTHLPIAYAAALTACAGVYAAVFGPEVVARCGEVLAPGVAVALLAVFLAPLANAEPGRLLPVGGVPWHGYLSGTVVTMTGLLRGFLPVLVLAPFSRPLSGRMPFVAVGLAACMLAAATALPIAVFGTPFAQTLANPFITAIGTVSWQWLPFERIVVVVTMAWYAIAFLVFATYLWMAAWLAKRMVPALPWSGLVLTLGIAGTVASSLNVPDPIGDRIALAWNGAVVVLGVLVPTALLLASPPPRPPSTGRAPRARAGERSRDGSVDGHRTQQRVSQPEGAAVK